MAKGIHIGSKLKDFIVNNYPNSLVDFISEYGITEAGFYKIVKKDHVSTKIIVDFCAILNKSITDFFCDCKKNTAMVSEPSPGYGINTGKYIELLEENRDLRIQLDAFKDINKPYKKISLKK